MNQNQPKPLIVSIEGNIGSGKSTLLRRLRELKPEWMFVDEPVDSWMGIRNDAGESLLEVFYKDIKRWAYTFQNAAVLSRGMMVREAFEQWKAGNVDQRQKVIFMERCVETDKNVFAKMLKADGRLDKIEWTLYEKWYEFISTQIPKIDLFIWVDVDASICKERIMRRGREGEEDIPLDYLLSLEKVHTEWLHDLKDAEVFRTCKADEIIEKIDGIVN